MLNEYYQSEETFLFAIADTMHEEYQAIVDAGFLLQIDDPDLPDGWNCLPDITLPDYRKYAALRVDALNHALRDIPREKVRLHVCWGSHHGPHHDDIPLRDIIDLIFRVNAGSFSIEASNPCHEHEWRVFEDVKLPQGATLIPGVVGHCTDFIEHPDLVAERLVRYAKLVGRENVLAGTDCGLGTRVGHPSICWAKFARNGRGRAASDEDALGALISRTARVTRRLQGREPMKNGFRVYDTDTHINPAAEVLDRYVDPDFRPRLPELAPYRAGGPNAMHTYRAGVKYDRRILGEAEPRDTFTGRD